MGGFQDGRNGLMHPSDGNYSTWRMGGAQRVQDDHWAGVTARHNAFMEQSFRPQANNHRQSGGRGGNVESPDEILQMFGLVAAVAVAIVFAALAFNGTGGSSERRGNVRPPATEAEPFYEEPLTLPPSPARVAERRRPTAISPVAATGDPAEWAPATEDEAVAPQAVSTDSGGSTDEPFLEPQPVAARAKSAQAEPEEPDSPTALEGGKRFDAPTRGKKGNVE